MLRHCLRQDLREIENGPWLYVLTRILLHKKQKQIGPGKSNTTDFTEIILLLRTANERRRFIYYGISDSLIGYALQQNALCFNL